jgi:hypothetical protein
MRPWSLSIAFILGATLAVGLTPMHAASASVPGNGDAAVAKRDKVAAATGSARAVQDYAYAQKAVLVRNAKKELAKIRRELDRLSAKVDHSSGTVKADAKAKLEVVRTKWAQTKEHLDQAARSTESTWDETKERLGNSYGELKDSLKQTRQWLSDKIAP